jgi:hypothetical protein
MFYLEAAVIFFVALSSSTGIIALSSSSPGIDYRGALLIDTDLEFYCKFKEDSSPTKELFCFNE